MSVSIWHRAWTFATGIAARHRRTHTGHAPTARVLARTTFLAQIIRRVSERHAHVHFAPRVALSLTLSSHVHRTETNGHAELRVAGAPRRAVEAERVARVRRELVERVLARSVRHERLAGAVPRPESASAPPVARVLRTLPPIPEVGVETRATAPRARTSSPAARASLTTVEVDQLTENVIRSIDRRLSAARERRGHS